MNALKIAASVVLSLFLFLSLVAFGLSFTIDRTVLRQQFVSHQLDRLDISSLVQETVTEDPGLSGETRNAVNSAVVALEPEIKAQFKAATARVYEYLVGPQQSIDLKEVLRQTVLSREFVASCLTEDSILALLRQDLRDELAGLIPPDEKDLVFYLDLAMPALDPWLKEQITAATGPVIDYLTGDSPSLNLSIPLDGMKPILKASVRAIVLKMPPSQLAGLPVQQVDGVFGEYYSRFAAAIPATAVVDASTIGIEPMASVTDSVAEAEGELHALKDAIGRFRLALGLLAAFTALLIIGILLVQRNVKGAALDLGIVFLVYGALQLAAVLVGSYFVRHLPASGVPGAVSSWLPGLYSDATRPLWIFSLVLTGVGVALLVLSMTYRERLDPVEPVT